MALLAFLERQADLRLILLWPCVHHLQETGADRKSPGPSWMYDYHQPNSGWGLAALPTREWVSPACPGSCASQEAVLFLKNVVPLLSFPTSSALLTVFW